jgi:hypothetical protein
MVILIIPLAQCIIHIDAMLVSTHQIKLMTQLMDVVLILIGLILTQGFIFAH